MAATLSEGWKSQIAEIAARISPQTVDSMHLLDRNQAEELTRTLKRGLADFLSATVSRCGHIRTLLYRDTGADLERVYVATTFEGPSGEISEEECVKYLAENKHIIISGNAGSGKSMFTKHLALAGLRARDAKIPIFVEMRNVEHTSSSIIQHILKDVAGAHFPDLTQTSLDMALKSGWFRLILDGFDETNFDRRDMYRRELDYISRRYSDLEVVLSTRPEEETLSLGGFDVFRVSPLSLPLASELISKIEFNPDSISRFIDALPDIYNAQPEFASSPLLLTMLLLTHDQTGETPQKKHIFYNQAFETLVLKHDRLKPHYTRITHSSTDLETLKRVFSHFCAASYANNEISFTESRCLELLQNAVEYVAVSVLADNLLRDFLFSFSMLKRDGLFVTFVHRSFQEYFCALFVSRMDEGEIGDAIEALTERGAIEQGTRMLFDMVPDRVASYWMRPLLERLDGQLSSWEANREIAAFTRAFYELIQIDSSDVLHVRSRNSILDKLALCAQLTDEEEDFASCLSRSNGTLDSSVVEAFFGHRPPFAHAVVEPTVEDDAWLRGSWLEDQLRLFRLFVGRAQAYLSELDALRADKGKISFKKPRQERPRVNSMPFPIKGKPQIVTDKRTGRRKEIPREAYTIRMTLRSEG